MRKAPQFCGALCSKSELIVVAKIAKKTAEVVKLALKLLSCTPSAGRADAADSEDGRKAKADDTENEACGSNAGSLTGSLDGSATSADTHYETNNSSSKNDDESKGNETAKKTNYDACNTANERDDGLGLAVVAGGSHGNVRNVIH